MSSFDTFINSFDPDSLTRGKQFERFVKWFLKNDPEWITQIDKVWLWDEYPDRWGPDCGIDLVFRHKNGEIWAAQAKCYDAKYSITKKDVDTFLSESNRQGIDKRLLIASTDQVGKNAREVCKAQEKPVTFYLCSDFNKAAIDYPSRLSELNNAKRKDPPTPRPHQKTAIKDVIKGFESASRGQMIMACGTGKTYTTLWIKEELKAKTTLVLLPSLSLLSQTLWEWTFASNNPFEALCVCSDETVGNNQDIDPIVSSTLDVSFPTTSDPDDIKKFLKRDVNKVIFSTYHSSPLIAEAYANSNLPIFDLAIADEAHRCTGETGRAFTTVLDNSLIKAHKRLFTTATPRVYSANHKKRHSEMGVDIADMSDEASFGKEFHKLTFAQAIEKDLLTDYRVVIVGVDEPMIAQWIDRRQLVRTDKNDATDAKTLASQVGLIKAIKDYDLKRMISFHGRVKKAELFASEIHDAIDVVSEEHRPKGKLYTDYVSGMMVSSKRRLKLSKLKTLHDADRGLLTNAKCLSEGIDVPSLDGIAFIDPRRSQVDIIQAVGRAIRKSEDKAFGTIVLPIFIEETDDAEMSIQSSNFKPIWDILNSLKSHDETLSLELGQIRTNLGRQLSSGSASVSIPEKIIFDLPTTIDNSFADSLKTILIEKTTDSWDFWYGLLLDYYDKFNTSNVPSRFETGDKKKLGKWIHNQRTNKKNKIISKDRIKKLENLGFIWNAFEAQWNEAYEHLKKYYEEYGNSYVPIKFKSEGKFPLGKWVSHQRTKKKEEELSTIQLRQLNELDFIWDTYEYKWKIGFALLKEYMINNNGKIPVQTLIVKDNYPLGKWVSLQRKDYLNNEISSDKILKLEGLGFVWTPRKDTWNESYEILKDYMTKHDGKNPSNSEIYKGFPVGSWTSTQRNKQSRNELSKIQIKKLEDIGISWNKFKSAWEYGFELLKKYHDYFGDTLVPSNFKSDNEFNLGNWVANQRTNYKDDKLSTERKQKLDALGFIIDVKEHQWNEAYEYLKEYMKTKDIIDITQVAITDDGFPIGTWIANQRANYRNDKIPIERKQKLDDLGFIWNVLEHQWNYGYEHLKAYIEINGPNIPMSCISDDEFNLGNWVGTQRKLKKANNLSEERIKLLDELGFVWQTKK